MKIKAQRSRQSTVEVTSQQAQYFTKYRKVLRLRHFRDLAKLSTYVIFKQNHPQLPILRPNGK